MPLVTVVAGNGAGATCELRVALYRSGCIKQRWTVEQEGGAIRIRGEDVGIVLVGGWDCPSWAPVNPATGTEYFKIGRADLQFALERLGGVVCFETVPELAPLNPHEAALLQAPTADASFSAQAAVTVTYSVRFGDRELEASVSAVLPCEVEIAVRALRRALSGKA